MSGAEEGDADQEYGKAGGKEEESDVVEVLHLLPTCPLKVVLRSRWREVADKCSDKTDASVYYGDIVTPSPARLEI